MESRKFDVAIVGGGAAGLCTAIRIKQLNSELSVCVLEQLSRVGKKLITTGNGRCNITNKNMSLLDYHGEDISFADYALSNFGFSFTEEFFENLGIIFTCEANGRAYPYSLQAASVVDTLRFSADKLGVEVFVDTKVIDIVKGKDYTVSTTKGNFFSRYLVIASGLLSGGKSLGSDGSVVQILKKMEYKTVKMTPAIVQLRTEMNIVRQLKGIKVNADASILKGKEVLRREYGEVLFCDYGLSGPAVMQLSRYADRSEGELTLSLDLMPEYSFGEILSILEKRVKNLDDRNFDEFFTGLLNKRLGQTVAKLCGYSMNDGVKKADSAGLKRMASIIKNMPFKVIGTSGFDNSQVTAGGLCTKQFDKFTMMSKKDKNLYAVGEVLDMDGDCGGFNLQWAWSSAMCAAQSIANGG